MDKIIEYYNKFNEEKRLLSRHGQVEYTISMHYVYEILKKFNNPKIIEIGAGTGRYSVALANEGYDVTAIELVRSNLGTLKAKKSSVKAYEGNALDLSRFKDNTFDVALLFGPMYHLATKEEQIIALYEAKRIVKDHGYILVAYVMNDYSIIKYGFMENHIKEMVDNKSMDSNYVIYDNKDNLYHYMNINKIDELNTLCNLQRYKIIGVDGASDYIRPYLNKMDEETFQLFIDYQLKNCERYELIGACSHTLDILYK